MSVSLGDTENPTRTFERGLLLKRLGGIEAQELSKLATVLSVLVDTEFQVLAKAFIKLVEVVLVLRDLAEKVQTLLDNVLTDHLEDLVLLESLAGNVEREILGVHNTLDEIEVFGDQVLAIVHDKDTADIELDVVTLLLGLEEIERSTAKEMSSASASQTSPLPLRNKEDGLELELTLNREVFYGEVVLPVVRKRFVEGSVFFSGNILRVARPDGLRLVELLVDDLLLLDRLRLLVLGLVFLVLDLLDLGFFLLLFRFLFFIFNFLYKRLESNDRKVPSRRTFSTSLVTASWMGYEMNSECFLTMSLIFFSSRYSV